MSGSQANCTDSAYNWVYNSLGQSPCFVAQSLGICGAQDTNIPPLPTGNTYGGPSVNERTDSCRCSSVYYSLLAACSACQDRNWIPWSTYTQNCSQIYLAVYPNTIPHSTRVPHWAYLNVSINDTFDVDAASNAGGPESAPPAPSSTGSLSNSSPNTVAIVSGVVGGFFGSALILSLSILVYRRRRSRKRRARIAALREGPGILATPPPLIAFHPPHTPNSF